MAHAKAVNTGPKLTEVQIKARISVAKSTGKLDLSGAGLTRIPSEVLKIKDLEELAINGNEFDEIPPEVVGFKNLKRLGAAGNRIAHVPKEIGDLEELEGLWLHGNQLEELPNTVGNLRALKNLSLSGNKLNALPEDVGRMQSLVELTVAGNNLGELPRGIGNCSNLKVVHLHGNDLVEVPTELCQCAALRTLYLQGNKISRVPENTKYWNEMQELSLADNLLEHLPDLSDGLQSLKTIYLYGNHLQDLPLSLAELPSLQNVWAENNPLEWQELQALLRKTTHLRSFGVDQGQIQSVPPSTSSSRDNACLKVSEIHSNGSPGYFKLQQSRVDKKAPVLIVAFGSAPGVPNWGGLLGRLRKAMPSGCQDKFDILFVVDPLRSWYSGNQSEDSHYAKQLKKVTSQYQRTILLGDSMGASACLLYAQVATSVLAFCPQVDLVYSSIRPGESLEWFSNMRDSISNSLKGYTGDVQVHTGSWEHDAYQAQLVEHFDSVAVTKHGIDSHRLALALHRQDKLLPIVRKKLEEELQTCSVGSMA